MASKPCHRKGTIYVNGAPARAFGGSSWIQPSPASLPPGGVSHGPSSPLSSGFRCPAYLDS